MMFYITKKHFIPIVLLLTFISLSSCLRFRKSDKSTIRQFAKINQTVQIYRDTFMDIPIRYMADKKVDDDLPTIIFVHGAPGSAKDFSKYLQDVDLQKQANLVVVDRLGYGYSNFGKSVVSIAKQAEFVAFIAKKYNKNKIILLGWSFGGPIVAKMAIDDQSYAHIVLLAPPISPADEKYFALGNLAKWKGTKWMVPDALVVAEDEKLAHAAELRLLEKDWKKIQTPITYYHGNKDNIAPYKNMKYFQSQISDSLLRTVTIEGGSHLIPIKQYELVKADLLDIINKF